MGKPSGAAMTERMKKGNPCRQRMGQGTFASPRTRKSGGKDQ